MAAQPLNEGEPLPDGECWARLITNSRHLTRDGNLHHSALKGRAWKEVFGQKWSHELSGRAGRRSFDFRKRGEAQAATARQNFLDEGKAVPSAVKFAGIAALPAETVRVLCDNLRTDVLFTPNALDALHSDLVAFGVDAEAVNTMNAAIVATATIIRVK